jgi:hypothetical protein
MFDWNIQSRAHACQACQRHFADKETFHTLLFDERHGYNRLDICEDCWKAQYSQGAVEKKGFISHWQSIYTPPPAAPPEVIQRHTAETLLRQLVEQNAPEHAGARFILAVMLERKRILKVKTQLVENGTRILIYEHGKTGDLLSIRDPKLELNHLEQVQKDVAHLLEHGLGITEPAPASVSENDSAAPIATPETTAESPSDSASTETPSPAPSETNAEAEAASNSEAASDSDSESKPNSQPDSQPAANSATPQTSVA